MKNQIDRFIQDKIKEEYRPIFLKFRSLIAKKYPQIKEEMRGGTDNYYGVPVYRNNRIIITVSPTQKGITFSFSEGKKFEDKYKLLEGIGNKTLNIRISKVGDLEDSVMEYYINQAVELDNH